MHAQNKMKRNFDKGHREVQFEVGDLVFVKLQPYCQHSILGRTNQKLSSRYTGPYPITHKISQVA